MIPKRVVIDTNVCLDLFVFRDPRWHVLHAALLTGEVDAVTRTDCRMEWLIVLGYSHLQLDHAAQQACAAAFDQLIRCLPDQPPIAEAALLPQCKDKDDQKFLELARDAGAAILITKDKALLKLAGKIRRRGLFSILTPQDCSTTLLGLANAAVCDGTSA